MSELQKQNLIAVSRHIIESNVYSVVTPELINNSKTIIYLLCNIDQRFFRLYIFYRQTHEDDWSLDRIFYGMDEIITGSPTTIQINDLYSFLTFRLGDAAYSVVLDEPMNEIAALTAETNITTLTTFLETL
jgi:hypothetical protein